LEKPPKGWTIDCEIVGEPYDCDTITVKVEKTLKIRLDECWSPEVVKTKITGEKELGLKARQWLLNYLDNYKDEEVTLFIPGSHSFQDITTLGRVLGRIFIGDKDLSEEAVKAGYAFRTKQELQDFLRNLQTSDRGLSETKENSSNKS